MTGITSESHLKTMVSGTGDIYYVANTDNYQRQASNNCSMSMKEHQNIGWCWGLRAAVLAGKEMDCSNCEFRKDKLDEKRNSNAS